MLSLKIIEESITRYKVVYGVIQMSARPFSKGHEITVNTAIYHLKNTAERISKSSGKAINWKLFFFVCSTNENDEKTGLPGKERYEVVREVFEGHKNIKVVWSHNAPQEFNLSWDDDKLWGKVALSHDKLPVVHFFYNSEDYGPGISQAMGAINVFVDKRRTTMPISGTKIRKEPMNNWNRINPFSRAYWWLNRYVIIGPEYSDNEKIANTLAEYFNTLYVNEYAGTEYDPDKKVCSEQNLQNIANVSLAVTSAAEKEAYQNLFRVGDALLTYVWYEELFPGKCPNWLIDMAKDSVQKNTYLFVDANKPADYGNTHKNITEWRVFKTKILNALDEFGAKYLLLTGDFDEMIQKAKEKVYHDTWGIDFVEKPEEIAERIISKMKEGGYRLGTMESCTGGDIGGIITNISGSGDVFEGGFMTYTNEMKCAMGVPKKTIDRHGVYSLETAEAMAKATIKKVKGINVAIGVTGEIKSGSNNPSVVYIGVCLDTEDKKLLLSEKISFKSSTLRREDKLVIIVKALQMVEAAI